MTNSADLTYQLLIRDVLNGTRRPSRGGPDTLSSFGQHYRMSVSCDAFPLLTTKRMSWKSIVVELLWFLSGDSTTDILDHHGLTFLHPWTDDRRMVPSPYGAFWRDFDGVDQIRFCLDELKSNPWSRRCVVSAWDPKNAVTSALPPCHAFWVLSSRPAVGEQNRLSLHLTQRSGDVALGIPFNIASYALLLCWAAQYLEMRPCEFSHTIVDAHIYTKTQDGQYGEYDHVPGMVRQLLRDAYPAPKLMIDPSITAALYDRAKIKALAYQPWSVLSNLFRLDGYTAHDSIQFRPLV